MRAILLASSGWHDEKMIGASRNNLIGKDSARTLGSFCFTGESELDVTLANLLVTLFIAS